jgi:signal transduction histidine kinase
MKIRTQYSLLTAVLIAAVVSSMALIVAKVEKTALEDESRQRLEALTEGISRIAQEAVNGSDELMLLSYLMFLQRERPEMASAVVNYRGHVSRIGQEVPEALVFKRRVMAKLSTHSVLPDARAIDFTISFNKKQIEDELNKALRPLLERTVIVAIIFVLLGTLGSAGLARFLTRRIVALTSAAMAVGQGHLDTTVPVIGRDEIGTLAERFNAMTSRLKQFSQFREDILHTLTHELNTPLSGLKGYLELWLDRQQPAQDAEEKERHQILETMAGAVLRMENSLGNALQLFKSLSVENDPAQRHVVWIESVINDTSRLWGW